MKMTLLMSQKFLAERVDMADLHAYRGMEKGDPSDFQEYCDKIVQLRRLDAPATTDGPAIAGYTFAAFVVLLGVMGVVCIQPYGLIINLLVIKTRSAFGQLNSLQVIPVHIIATAYHVYIIATAYPVSGLTATWVIRKAMQLRWH